MWCHSSKWMYIKTDFGIIRSEKFLSSIFWKKNIGSTNPTLGLIEPPPEVGWATTCHQVFTLFVVMWKCSLTIFKCKTNIMRYATKENRVRMPVLFSIISKKKLYFYEHHTINLQYGHSSERIIITQNLLQYN